MNATTFIKCKNQMLVLFMFLYPGTYWPLSTNLILALWGP